MLNIHLWCKPWSSQKLTTPVFQSPTFALLDLNSDSKWYANINAFLLDHAPSQVMDFYRIFENNRGLNTASSLSGGSDGDRNSGGKEGGDGGGITNLSIYLGIGDVPMRSVWSRFLCYLGTTRETLSTLSFSYLLTIELQQCYNNVMNQDLC